VSDFHLYCWEGYDCPQILGRFGIKQELSTSAERLTSDTEATRRVLDGSIHASILNINNPYPRKVLFPEKRILKLNKEDFGCWADGLLPWVRPLCNWAYGVKGELLAIPQRFGSFNFVINTDRISIDLAKDEGFSIVSDSKTAPKYGILLFPEFNVFHIALAAGLDPFRPLSADEMGRFRKHAELWFSNAAYVSGDSTKLNKLLIDKKIDLILSAGTFSSGLLRLMGHEEVYCVTPDKGPINGKGAISFVELNAVPSNTSSYDTSINFLKMILSPDMAPFIASNEVNCNPIAQMGDHKVFEKMTSDLLTALQWDTLEEDLSQCVEYDLPPNMPELLDSVNNATKLTDRSRLI
jgi:spermidine/putrescine transport system substrate-binding protein